MDSNAIAAFLDQLIATLAAEKAHQPAKALRVSGPANGKQVQSEIGETAALHGRALAAQSFTVDQVVHDYGDLCQAITDLAVESNTDIKANEFRTMNRCLDNAIADAVTEFAHQRDTSANGHEIERLGFLAHELRNQLLTATLALQAIKTGQVGLGGSTGRALDRSLLALGGLIDRSLDEVRNASAVPTPHRLMSLARFVDEVKDAASLDARRSQCELVVAKVDASLGIEVDAPLLAAAVGNLLQNAFKYSRRHSDVSLTAYASADRVLIEVEDRCGGLPPGLDRTLFRPFVQGGPDRSGLGLGLAIANRNVLLNHGVLSVLNRPGVGCVFTVDLPRKLWSEDAPAPFEKGAADAGAHPAH